MKALLSKITDNDLFPMLSAIALLALGIVFYFVGMGLSAEIVSYLNLGNGHNESVYTNIIAGVFIVLFAIACLGVSRLISKR